MKTNELCESRSDSSGLPYICSLAAGHAGDHEAHTDMEGTIAATWPSVEIVSVVTDLGSTKWIVRVNGRAVRNFWTRKGADRYLAKLAA